jgi:hypothetical protein
MAPLPQRQLTLSLASRCMSLRGEDDVSLLFDRTPRAFPSWTPPWTSLANRIIKILRRSRISRGGLHSSHAPREPP